MLGCCGSRTRHLGSKGDLTLPSPLGHALGGLAAGLFVARLAGRPAAAGPVAAGNPPRPIPASPVEHMLLGRPAAAYAVLGLAADVDFAAGTHSSSSA